MSHASSSKICKYDVFLSFRGEDTRRTFVSHLYNALEQRGIHTFKDDERLETGKTISGELLKAIEEVKFAVVIFSKSYASSRWCLEELAHIIKCKNELDQIVIPIFYDVSPSDVRHRYPPFAESFSQHEENCKDDMEKVQRWRDAFVEAGKIAGYHLQNFKDEIDCIKKVVDYIFPKLLQVNPPFPESLIGMKDQVEKVISLLDTKSNDNVRFVGICGMGGIGKTKIAMVIFEKYRSEFEGACFLDVGEGPRDNGIRWLQHALMYELFNEDLNVTSSYKGKNLIRKCHKKKVFIVLDNVNRKEELEALVGGREWFGEGSRILITTRYQRLLVTHMDEGYEVQLLPKHEAVELFRRHAFRSESPKEGFRGLSSQVVEYADGLPLALEVLGSLLYQRDEEEWRRIIARLKKIPNKDILGKLKISFDGLDKEEKRIFLDIACLYSDDSIDYVKRVFESCDINLQGIKNLVEKSLLSINRYRSLMHNTIREMGQNIAREEYTNSRIWLPEDVRDLFEGKLEAEKVEGMRSSETHYFKDEAFKKMQRLQVLKIDDIKYGHVNGSTITYLPTSLRWVDWKCYPSSSLPEYFEPLHLVGLSLIGSKLVKHFWPTSKKLSNLKHLDLSESVGLTKTPNFGDMSNLETLILQRCKNLEEVHPSLGHCKMLTYLNLCECIKLKKLPELKLGNLKNLNLSGGLIGRCMNMKEVHPSLGHCRMLTYLNLMKCGKLKKLPELKLSNLKELDLSWCHGLTETPNFGDMPNLETLILWGCKNLEEVHPSLGHCRLLTNLNLNRCEKLKKFPELKLGNLKKLNLSGGGGLIERFVARSMNLEVVHMNLEVVHPSLGHCRMLTYLNLSACGKLKKLPELKLGNLKNLHLSRCGGLIETPNFGDMPNLETLYLWGCKNLEEVHSSLGHCRVLTILDLSNCDKLKKLPELGLSNLKQLNLSGCGGLIKTPNFGDLPNLETLDLRGCKNLEEVDPSIGHCRVLTRLDLSHCDKLKKLPELKLGNLKHLYLEGCSGLTETPNFGDMPNLEILNLEGCKNLKEVHPSIGHCRVLTRLDLSHCDKLKKLPELKLGNLKHLYLEGCSGLTETPNFGDMPNLEILNLEGCKNLKEVHPSIGHCRVLTRLDLSHCDKLKKLPEFVTMESLDKCTSLEEFPEMCGDMRHLRRLIIKSTGIRELPSSIGNLSGLTELNLKDCEDLVILPDNLCNLNNLKHLDLCGCKKLEKLPENIGELQELETLDARKTAISQPPPSITKLGKLSNLNILGGLPEDLGSLQSLKSLDVSGSNISCLPKSIKELLGLQALDVQFCQNLNELPEELPPNLEKLCADYHLSLKSIRDLVIKYLKLRFLSISRCGNEKSEYGTVSSEQINVLKLLQHFRRTCIQCDFYQRDYFLISFPEVKIPELFYYQFMNQKEISIELNLSWYTDKFMGFSICCTHKDKSLVATLVCKSDPERKHSLKYNFHGYCSSINMCCIYIPFEILWRASDNKERKNPNDYCRFEVSNKYGKEACWGIRLEYENKDRRCRRKKRAMQSPKLFPVPRKDTAVTTEIKQLEPSHTSRYLQATTDHNIATDRGLLLGYENEDVEVDQAAMAVQKEHESQNVEMTRVSDSPSRKIGDASRKRKRNRNKKRKRTGIDETSCSYFTNKHPRF